MTEEKFLELEKNFASLRAWAPLMPETLTPFVLLCLETLRVMSENDKQVKNIATHLSLILNARPSLEDNLRTQLQRVESSLEDGLRGFSSLLDLVLEEHSLKINTDDILESVLLKDRDLADKFCRLTRQIDVLVDLDMAFEMGRPKVLSLLFLLGLEEIISFIFATPPLKARLLIGAWLEKSFPQSILNPLLAPHLDYNDVYSMLDYCRPRNPSFEELILAFLSRASADNSMLPNDCYEPLDAILKDMGLLGLEPLVDSGFLNFPGSETMKNVAKVFYVV